ncbi:unnamed protein product [Tetraodon nigroviridis]|uniref:(spotted green pufferfish) hypothetical protein n=1 Tax=Tetraodon nigroviridis TaxID=99883 RepID=Q4T631_TETNG|nr:unnamed protein product [Tetraodon nigroviridis]
MDPARDSKRHKLHCLDKCLFEKLQGDQNHETESRFAVASGGKVISNGFSVYTNTFGGYVEFYTRGNNHRWKANIKVPGPYWTHILFTWTKTDGLKVFINGTFTTGDATGGNVSESYGDPYPDLLIGTGNNKAYGHYVTGAFDEFVIWERALSPKEISLYYRAATGQALPSTTAAVVNEVTSTTPTFRSTEMSPPGVPSQPEEVRSSQDPHSVLGFLTELPNKTIPHNTASNLTQTFLRSVEEVLSSPVAPEQSTAVASGLIGTVDRVMEHMVKNLEPSPNSLISLGGTSFVADYSLMKFPQKYNLLHYRFPTEGKNYISVPGEALAMKSQTTIVGLYYHNMHGYYREISPVKTRISKAADFKDHKIQVASCLISLKVEPSPALSSSLLGGPLIKIVLTHMLVSLTHGMSFPCMCHTVYLSVC